VKTRLSLCIEARGNIQSLAPKGPCDAHRDIFSAEQAQLLILIKGKGEYPHSSTFPSPSLKHDKGSLDKRGQAATHSPRYIPPSLILNIQSVAHRKFWNSLLGQIKPLERSIDTVIRLNIRLVGSP
jgi:hypothetical protein